MPERQLNLLERRMSAVGELGESAPEIVQRDISKAQSARVFTVSFREACVTAGNPRW